MKVLLIGSHMNYNLEHYIYMNLVKLGNEVRFYGYSDKLGRLANLVRMAITRSKLLRDVANLLWLNKINEEIRSVAESFRPDLVLSIKGEAVKPETIEWIRKELGTRTALWYPDDPRFFDSLVSYIAPSYDYVFTASQKAIPMYKEIGCDKVHFLPFACEPTIHKKIDLSKDERRIYGSDATFIGTYTRKRARIIRTLEKAGIKVKVYGPYWRYFKRGANIHDGIYGPEMVKAFNATKVVINIHANREHGPNMRVFEAIGSKAFLITDEGGDVEKFFKKGSEVEIFTDKKELIRLVKHYLNNEDIRSTIATNGYVKCHDAHTYSIRLTQMLSFIK